jgi:hypothetical protein
MHGIRLRNQIEKREVEQRGNFIARPGALPYSNRGIQG